MELSNDDEQSPLSWVFEKFKKFKFELNETKLRYVVRGIIDGSLSTLGVVIGASGGDSSLIIAAGIGGGIANGLSNILGALTAEKASLEKEREMQERSLLKENGYLKKTVFYKRAVHETIVCGFVDGISTMLGSMLPVVPFFIFEPKMAVIVAIIITLAILFALGIFIGRISRENLAISGLKMVIGGVLVALAGFAIERIFG